MERGVLESHLLSWFIDASCPCYHSWLLLTKRGPQILDQFMRVVCCSGFGLRMLSAVTRLGAKNFLTLGTNQFGHWSSNEFFLSMISSHTGHTHKISENCTCFLWFCLSTFLEKHPTAGHLASLHLWLQPGLPQHWLVEETLPQLRQRVHFKDMLKYA